VGLRASDVKTHADVVHCAAAHATRRSMPEPEPYIYEAEAHPAPQLTMPRHSRRQGGGKSAAPAQHPTDRRQFALHRSLQARQWCRLYCHGTDGEAFLTARLSA
jgi:hypothetical protein